MLRHLILPGLFALISGTVLWKHAPERIEALQRSYEVAAVPPLAEIHPAFVNILTLGHKNIYDDFINLWLLQTLLDSRKVGEVDQLMKAIRSVIRHHPKTESLYMLSCFTMYLDYKKPENCQEIILAGLDAFPQSWRLPMTQGYVHYFLLKEPAQAASFFMMAASRPQSPDYVKSLVKKLLQENELNADDLQRSMDIMSASPIGQEFVKILQNMGKSIPAHE